MNGCFLIHLQISMNAVRVLTVVVSTARILMAVMFAPVVLDTLWLAMAEDAVVCIMEHVYEPSNTCIYASHGCSAYTEAFVIARMYFIR